MEQSTSSDALMRALTSEGHTASVAANLEQAAKDLTQATLELAEELDYDTEGLKVEAVAKVAKWANQLPWDADGLRTAEKSLRRLDVAGQELDMSKVLEVPETIRAKFEALQAKADRMTSEIEEFIAEHGRLYSEYMAWFEDLGPVDGPEAEDRLLDRMDDESGYRNFHRSLERLNDTSDRLLNAPTTQEAAAA